MVSIETFKAVSSEGADNNTRYGTSFRPDQISQTKSDRIQPYPNASSINTSCIFEKLPTFRQGRVRQAIRDAENEDQWNVGLRYW
jgi:hypothetical protein